jgi:branched-chain amino acid transport system substrate-binding protein
MFVPRELSTRRQILKRIGIAGTAGIASTSGCLGDGGGSGGGTYKIGFANSETGSLDTFGQRNERAKTLAVQAINDVGLRGGELEVATEDTQSEEGPGVQAANNLVNQEEVPVIIGAVGSGTTQSIYQSVIQGTDVAQISQNSTAPGLSDFPDLMRMSPPGAAQAGIMADLMTQDGHSSVAIGYINNAYGQGIAEVIRDSFEGEVTYFQPHEQGQSDYSNTVTEMADSGADAWCFITYQPEFATLAQNAQSGGYTDVALYGGDSTKGPDVLEQAPEGFLEGMKVLIPAVDQQSETYQDFVSEFESEYDTSPTSWSAYCYDAFVTVALGIQADDAFMEDGESDRVATLKDVTRPDGQEVTSFQAAVDVLEDGGGPSDIDYTGVSGPIDLDENGDPAPVLQVFQVQDGEYVSQQFITGD